MVCAGMGKKVITFKSASLWISWLGLLHFQLLPGRRLKDNVTHGCIGCQQCKYTVMYSLGCVLLAIYSRDCMM